VQTSPLDGHATAADAGAFGPDVGVLEIIVTSVEDAQAAQRGGADRLEVVSGMEQDGLTPSVALVARLVDAVALPTRVMLRRRAVFGIDAAELEALGREAQRLRAAGASEFVFGFVGRDGRLDWEAMTSLHQAAAPLAWTLHRAFDHATDAEAAFAESAGRPGLDAILSSGDPGGLDAGMATLLSRAGWQTAALRFLAGGGLRREHVAPLVAAGITQVHAGRAVRRGASWAAPVDERLVRTLKDALEGPAARVGP
jgi:copper homeostasis protein